MSIISKRPARLLISLGAAFGLVVTAAAPAAADNLPEDTDVELEVVGGFLRVGENEFPLAEDDPNDRCASADPSVITATIGPEDSTGEAAITNVVSDFDATEVAQDPFLGTEICARIVITNAPEGRQVQTGDGVGDLWLDDPGIVADVEFSGPFVPPDCRIAGIQHDDPVAPIDLHGDIDGTGPTWDAFLEADPDGFHVPKSEAECGIAKDPIDTELGLPEDDTAAEFEFSVTEQ